MQNIVQIQASDTLADSRTPLNDAVTSLLSCNSGTAFPTSNVQIGQLCFRTDENKLYELKELPATNPSNWKLIADLGKTYLSKEDADSLYQPKHTELTGLAAISSNGAIERTGAGTYSTFAISSFAKTILDDTDAATVRSTIGVVAASESAAGLAELATSAEVAAGSDTARVVTPAGLAANVNYQGRQTIWVPASAMRSRSTDGAGPLATVLMGAGRPEITYMPFSGAARQYVEFSVGMPKSWDLGALRYEFVWSHPSTDTNFGVTMELAALARSNDDAMSASYGTATAVSDTGGTTNDQYVSPESGDVNVAGTPAAGDVVYFLLSRNPSDGNDTLAVDLRLHGVRIFYSTNKKNDA